MTNPHTFAEEWIAAWNARDLERVLGHYAEDVVFHSPYAARVMPQSGGIINGKPLLREYWEAGLNRNPDLAFHLIKTVVGVRSVCLIYRNHRGFTAAETMVFNLDGLVIAAYAHYTEAELVLD